MDGVDQYLRTVDERVIVPRSTSDLGHPGQSAGSRATGVHEVEILGSLNDAHP